MAAATAAGAVAFSGPVMSGAELAALLLFCAAMSFSPGPNTTLSAALGANGGLRLALRFCLAVPAGWVLLMLATGLGLGALVAGVPLLRWGVKAGGIAYLLWLAWKLALGPLPAGLGAGRASAADDGMRAAPLAVGFWQGVWLQFLNIKAWMLSLTLSAGWVVHAQGLPAPNPQARLLLVMAVMAAFAFGSNFSYALAGALLRGWLAEGRRLRVFNRALALVLVLTAAWMAGL